MTEREPMVDHEADREPTLIAIAVVEDRDRFLVGQRPAGIPLAGCSEFPGGKVEPGESPVEAAVRECREETGLEVVVAGTLTEQLHEYPHDQLRLLFFHCQLTTPGQQPRAPFRWVARNELSQLQFPAANAALLELLLRAGD